VVEAGAKEMSGAFSVSETSDAIDRLKDLRQDWDSYGAGEIMVSARERAKRFVEDVAQSLGPRFTRPTVGPTADGGVVLIWRQKAGLPKAEAFFSPTGAGRYVVVVGRTVLEQGPIKDAEFLKRHITLF
jgi:hypothetical protein